MQVLNKSHQKNVIGYLKGVLSVVLSGGYDKQTLVITVKPGFINTKMTSHLDLPKILTATPEDISRDIINSIREKKNVVYSKWFWKWIMMIIKIIPETIFKKLKLLAMAKDSILICFDPPDFSSAPVPSAKNIAEG